MNERPIPPHVKRFLLTSIDSVPHLEAVLLLRKDPGDGWDPKSMARRIYISEKKAAALLDDLHRAGFAVIKEEPDPQYYFAPISRELEALVEETSEHYAKNLIEVTALIHSKIDKQAQKFGDAFRWKGESQ